LREREREREGGGEGAHVDLVEDIDFCKRSTKGLARPEISLTRGRSPESLFYGSV